MIMLNIPTVSSSKNPREVRPMYEPFKARKKAENNPTSFPPISFPKKYIARTVRVAMITGKITTKLYTGSAANGFPEYAGVIGTPKALNTK